MHRTKLVSKVRIFVLQIITSILLTMCLSRCTAPADGLDEGTYGRRSRDHTEMLVEEFELGVLWDEYGLVGDVVVRTISLLLHPFIVWDFILLSSIGNVFRDSLIIVCTGNNYGFTAIYQLFSASRHTRAPLTRHFTSTDQGSIQGSLRYMGE
jgi:hypothetical protein